MELLQTRSNLRYVIDTNSTNLKPEIEVVLICSELEYITTTIGGKTFIAKELKPKTLRFTSSLEELNNLIEELQKISEQAEQYEKIGNTINESFKK